jgi:hypothetical protein
MELALEGELLVGEVAVGRNNDGVDDAGDERRVGAQRRDVEEDVGRDRKDDELGRGTDAVDREAAKPLLQVVAVGAEDEVLVAEEGDGDGEGLGEDGGNVGNEGLAAIREQVAEENDKARVEGKGDKGVGGSDEEKANDFASGKDAPESCECTVSLRVGWSAVSDGEGGSSVQ